MDARTLLNTAVQAIREAGRAVLTVYRSDFSVSEKDDETPVTEADVQSNDILRDALAHLDVPILSEESADNLQRIKHEHTWIIDPIDGTQDFIDKTDEFSIMVGLAQHGKPLLGIVYLPAMDKLYWAMKGHGSFMIHNGKEQRLIVTKIRQLQDATLVASRSHFDDRSKSFQETNRMREVKKVGSNGIKMGLISQGDADVFMSFTDKLGEWDACASHIIVEEAGGKVTGLQGQEIQYNKKIPRLTDGLVVTNGLLHDKTLSQLKPLIDD